MVKPFDEHSKEYERWFDDNEFVYRSELEAVRSMMPGSGRGIEIGVGTGRFAVPLGVRLGLEPSSTMRGIAESRGIEVVDGVAEKLPFEDDSFDYVLMVTTLCFLDDVERAFAEVRRILKNGGILIVGMLDRESPLGRLYDKHRERSVFYREARFFSVSEVAEILGRAGFGELDYVQTVFGNLEKITSVESWRKGYGKGVFVVIRALK